MLRIWFRERGRWVEVPSGPFPITDDQLTRARGIFQTELDVSPPLAGANATPQTTARRILESTAPQLDSFDRLMLGFAVTTKIIKAQEV